MSCNIEISKDDWHRLLNIRDWARKAAKMLESYSCNGNISEIAFEELFGEAKALGLLGADKETL